MTTYSLLSVQTQLVLSGVLFLSALSQFAVCLYRYICTGIIKKCVKEFIVFILLIILISFSVSTRITGGQPIYAINIPWAFFPLLSFVVAFDGITSFILEYKENALRLSSDSVRQTMNGLDSGICFADESGGIVLINRTMNQLIFGLLKQYPRKVESILFAFRKNAEEISDLGSGKNVKVYKLPSGQFWRLSVIPIQESGLNGFTQINAQNVTELHNVNRKLEKENIEIRAAILKMGDMINRMSDLAREQETLNLKMRVHNEIGASLITLSRLANGEIKADAQAQICALEEALSYLSGAKLDSCAIDEEIVAFAKKMGVELKIEGEYPENEEIKGLTVAAIRECITNCVRHAGGDSVNVALSQSGDKYEAVITNSGDLPKSQINEGTGLSTLRKKVEAAGGKMEIKTLPEFALLLKLYERKNTND
ncbi:MAG: hypothetical protein J5659_05020 [Clostridia bacterium]|nr:hypothetical protein [Clostridia bacterium]